MGLRIVRLLTIFFSLAHHRFSTRFGEDRCRTSVHSVVEAPARKRGLILTVISKAPFNIPSEYRECLRRFGWTILFMALLGASMYLRESRTYYKK